MTPKNSNSCGFILENIETALIHRLNPLNCKINEFLLNFKSLQHYIPNPTNWQLQTKQHYSTPLSLSLLISLRANLKHLLKKFEQYYSPFSHFLRTASNANSSNIAQRSKTNICTSFQQNTSSSTMLIYNNSRALAFFTC